MLSAICKNADFDFDDADEDEYDPVLGMKQITIRLSFDYFELHNQEIKLLSR